MIYVSSGITKWFEIFKLINEWSTIKNVKIYSKLIQSLYNVVGYLLGI